MLVVMNFVSQFVKLALVAVLCPALFTACDSAGPPSSAAAPTAGASAAEIRHVDAAGAAALLREQRGVVVLDVRTPGEFAQGHLAGATNLDYNAAGFAQALAALDRDRTYLVHCASGGRSTRSLESFRQLGFKSVVHLDGGFNAWQKAGQAVER